MSGMLQASLPPSFQKHPNMWRQIHSPPQNLRAFAPRSAHDLPDLCPTFSVSNCQRKRGRDSVGKPWLRNEMTEIKLLILPCFQPSLRDIYPVIYIASTQSQHFDTSDTHGRTPANFWIKDDKTWNAMSMSFASTSSIDSGYPKLLLRSAAGVFEGRHEGIPHLQSTGAWTVEQARVLDEKGLRVNFGLLPAWNIAIIMNRIGRHLSTSHLIWCMALDWIQYSHLYQYFHPLLLGKSLAIYFTPKQQVQGTASLLTQRRSSQLEVSVPKVCRTRENSWARLESRWHFHPMGWFRKKAVLNATFLGVVPSTFPLVYSYIVFIMRPWWGFKMRKYAAAIHQYNIYQPISNTSHHKNHRPSCW